MALAPMALAPMALAPTALARGTGAVRGASLTRTELRVAAVVRVLLPSTC
ncbi:hypothetical protein AB0K35_14620 [Micromonospora sp. NPDC053740]